MPTPTLLDVLDYLGDTSYTDDQVQAALDAEAAAQRRRCRVPADMPADLAEALKRRVARNLAARAVTVVTAQVYEGGSTTTRVPTVDPEVRRLEADWRRKPVG